MGFGLYVGDLVLSVVVGLVWLGLSFVLLVYGMFLCVYVDVFVGL